MCLFIFQDSEQMKLKGNELFQAGKFDEAIRCYSEAITILWVCFFIRSQLVVLMQF